MPLLVRAGTVAAFAPPKGGQGRGQHHWGERGRSRGGVLVIAGAVSTRQLRAGATLTKMDVTSSFVSRGAAARGKDVGGGWKSWEDDRHSPCRRRGRGEACRRGRVVLATAGEGGGG